MIRLASLGLLGNFVGMLTDSRSFLSYTRHDYFRRILCNLIGGWVENGEYPNDEKALEKIVKGICFDNAKRYSTCKRFPLFLNLRAARRQCRLRAALCFAPLRPKCTGYSCFFHLLSVVFRLFL